MLLINFNIGGNDYPIFSTIFVAINNNHFIKFITVKKLLIYTWLPALLFAFATIGFTACGSDDDDDPTTPPKTEQGPTGGDSTTEGEGSEGGEVGEEGEKNEEENGVTSQEPAITIGEAIDLGLPSGTKWASCNVGATAPEECGGYYAWGETEQKETYNTGNYSFYNKNVGPDIMSKYCTDSHFGNVDGKTVLEPEDDVAHTKLSGTWRIPTIEDFREIEKYCKRKTITYKGVKGCQITGPNGNSIFLPAAGYMDGSTICKKDEYGEYWLSKLNGSGEYEAMTICNTTYDSQIRWYGLPVRPVCQ